MQYLAVYLARWLHVNAAEGQLRRVQGGLKVRWAGLYVLLRLAGLGWAVLCRVGLGCAALCCGVLCYNMCSHLQHDGDGWIGARIARCIVESIPSLKCCAFFVNLCIVYYSTSTVGWEHGRQGAVVYLHFQSGGGELH
jgi:hypothetical protein